MILRLSRLATRDATDAAVERTPSTDCRPAAPSALLPGVKARHWKVLSALDIEDSLADPQHVFPTTVASVEAARQLVAAHQSGRTSPGQRATDWGGRGACARGVSRTAAGW